MGVSVRGPSRLIDGPRLGALGTRAEKNPARSRELIFAPFPDLQCAAASLRPEPPADHGAEATPDDGRLCSPGPIFAIGEERRARAAPPAPPAPYAGGPWGFPAISARDRSGPRSGPSQPRTVLRWRSSELIFHATFAPIIVFAIHSYIRPLSLGGAIEFRFCRSTMDVSDQAIPWRPGKGRLLQDPKRGRIWRTWRTWRLWTGASEAGSVSRTVPTFDCRSRHPHRIRWVASMLRGIGSPVPILRRPAPGNGGTCQRLCRHFPVQFSDPSFPPWAGSAPQPP